MYAVHVLVFCLVVVFVTTCWYRPAAVHVPVCNQSQPADAVLQADETLAKFLDFCTYGHMIDNVVLIVTGTLHERDVQVGHVCVNVLLVLPVLCVPL
jgi:hypothetical protein